MGQSLFKHFPCKLRLSPVSYQAISASSFFFKMRFSILYQKFVVVYLGGGRQWEGNRGFGDFQKVEVLCLNVIFLAKLCSHKQCG